MDTIFCRGGVNEMEKKNARFSPLEKHKIMDLKSQGHGYKAIRVLSRVFSTKVVYFFCALQLNADYAF